MDFSKHGQCIGDWYGELRNNSEIIAELKDIYSNHSTHSMSDYTLFLQGQKDALGKVIEYLERV